MAYHHAGESYRNGGTWRESEHQFVYKAGTVRRLEALMWLGYSSREIAERTGQSRAHLQNVRNDKKCTRITKRIADPIAAVYDELWDKPVTTANGRRRHAQAVRLGYLPPLAYDDDRIDDPDYVPELPGNGTWERKPCGTTAAYQRHLRAGETPCNACRDAQRIARKKAA
jgi:hypothetical protein